MSPPTGSVKASSSGKDPSLGEFSPPLPPAVSPEETSIVRRITRPSTKVSTKASLSLFATERLLKEKPAGASKRRSSREESTPKMSVTLEPEPETEHHWDLNPSGLQEKIEEMSPADPGPGLLQEPPAPSFMIQICPDESEDTFESLKNGSRLPERKDAKRRPVRSSTLFPEDVNSSRDPSPNPRTVVKARDSSDAELLEVVSSEGDSDSGSLLKGGRQTPEQSPPRSSGAPITAFSSPEKSPSRPQRLLNKDSLSASIQYATDSSIRLAPKKSSSSRPGSQTQSARSSPMKRGASDLEKPQEPDIMVVDDDDHLQRHENNSDLDEHEIDVVTSDVSVPAPVVRPPRLSRPKSALSPTPPAHLSSTSPSSSPTPVLLAPPTTKPKTPTKSPSKPSSSPSQMKVTSFFQSRVSPEPVPHPDVTEEQNSSPVIEDAPDRLPGSVPPPPADGDLEVSAPPQEEEPRAETEEERKKAARRIRDRQRRQEQRRLLELERTSVLEENIPKLRERKSAPLEPPPQEEQTSAEEEYVVDADLSITILQDDRSLKRCKLIETPVDKLAVTEEVMVPSFHLVSSRDSSKRQLGDLSDDEETDDEAFDKRHKRIEMQERRVRNREKERYLHELQKINEALERQKHAEVNERIFYKKKGSPSPISSLFHGPEAKRSKLGHSAPSSAAAAAPISGIRSLNRPGGSFTSQMRRRSVARPSAQEGGAGRPLAKRPEKDLSRDLSGFGANIPAMKPQDFKLPEFYFSE